MNAVLQARTVARQPRQLRARERFNQVLEAAEQLLRESGLSGFSIPALADALGYTRASIYKFFPTPYAVLNELVHLKLGQLEARLAVRAAGVLDQPWPESLRAITHEAVAYYNADPVARMLVLGGPVSDDSFRAQEFTIQRLGALTRELLRTRGINLPKSKPDVAALLVDIGTTCFRLSQFLHGEITREYRDEAVYAMQVYLTRYTQGATASRKLKVVRG